MGSLRCNVKGLPYLTGSKMRLRNSSMRNFSCWVVALLLASSCDRGPSESSANADDVGVRSCVPDASYLACGCGCCTGASTQERCVDLDAGQTLQQIVDADKSAAGSPNCAMAGCSMPTLYRCCN